ncbi:DUF1542 domain-containing protein [Streptococcus suis]|uniref:DUF1542 domain-containing protein n=2 Tax=Streptococcus suis TaxID=1307 RepID=UPI0007695C58|nr:DUF1542 domain-containing protein [Streptococcus suis]CYV78159.1 RTX family exoprotein A gene [Streptococcus suis]
MSKKDMFRKEQRFSFRKFSFGLASAVIANVIFGGAIANSPVVHANTETRAESAETVSSAIGEPVKLNAATIPVSPEGEQTLSEENQASKQAENQEAATFDKTLLEKLILEADLLIKEGEKKLADNAELGAAVAAAKPVLGAAQAVFSDQAASAEQVAEQEEALRQASSKVGDQLALLSEDGNVTVVLTTSAATDDMIRCPSTADEATPKGYVRVEFAQGPYTKSGAWVWKGNPGEFRNAKKVVYFVKEGTTWGQLVDNPQFIFPEADLEDSDVVVGWIWNNTGYSPNIALQPRKKHQNSLVINSVLKPNVVYKAEQVEPLNASIEEYKGKYSEEDAEKWRFITFDAQGGQAPVKNQVNGSIVQRTLYSVAVYYQGIAYSNGEFTKRVFNPTLDKHTFVRWQTDEKKVLPKDATIISEDETYKALYIKHLDTQITVGNQAALKPKEKAAVEAAIRQANPDTADLIETITVNDNGSVVVTYKGGGSVTLPTHLNVVEDLETAKADANKAIDDAKAAALSAIEASNNLTPEQRAAAKQEVETAATEAKQNVASATTPELVQEKETAGVDAIKAKALETAKADANKAIDDAKAAALSAIEASNNLTPEQRAAAKQEVETAATKANTAIDVATTPAEAQVAEDKGVAAITGDILDVAKQDAKNKVVAEADAVKAAIDNNPGLSDVQKTAGKADIDKAVEAALISINGAGTYYELLQIKLPVAALIKPVVQTTPVVDPNNLTDAELARIKVLLEENNDFPAGTEIIVAKAGSVTIKYPDGSIDLVTPAETVKQADLTAPVIEDDAKGNIVITPSEEATKLVITYVDKNGKAQTVVVTKDSNGLWTTTDAVVIVDSVTGQVTIPDSEMKPNTQVTAYSEDEAGNVSATGLVEIVAVDENNPSAGVKVKSADKKAKQLPNTGEKDNSVASLGLAALGMGLALFAAKRKKDEEEA